MAQYYQGTSHQQPVPEILSAPVFTNSNPVVAAPVGAEFQEAHVVLDRKEFDRLQTLARECDQNRLTLQERDRQLSQLREQYHNLEQTHASTLQKLEDQIVKLETNRRAFETDNNTLRAYISSLKTPQLQIKDDIYYGDSLQGLNRLIQSSVAKIFIDPRRVKTLSKAGGLKILQVLSEILPIGNFTATLLQTPEYDSIWTLQKDARKRIAFARHMIALYLWHYVFAPVAFGLPVEESNRWRNIEDYIMVNEPDFSRVLMIRHAVGRAILHQVSGTQANAKKAVIDKLAGTLSLIVSKNDELNYMLVSIVEQAVALANQMTAEFGLFKCQMAKTGINPGTDPYLKIPDESQSGLVFMCTFPSFGRRVINEGKEIFVCLVKANAELVSAFRRGDE